MREPGWREVRPHPPRDGGEEKSPRRRREGSADHQRHSRKVEVKAEEDQDCHVGGPKAGSRLAKKTTPTASASWANVDTR
jgi:hypothetical protein